MRVPIKCVKVPAFISLLGAKQIVSASEICVYLIVGARCLYTCHKNPEVLKVEIEKKFLVKNMPEKIESYKSYTIEQAYLSDSPVVRIRKKTSTDRKEFFLTVKSSGMFAREEVESAITESTYYNFLKEAKVNIITTQRYILPLPDGLKAELDIFSGVFEGVILVEVEFPDETCAKKFTPPPFFGDEVTFDNHFHNSNMSKMSANEISNLVHFVNAKSSD